MSHTVRKFDPRINPEDCDKPWVLGTDNITPELSLDGRRIGHCLGYALEGCRSRGRGGISREKRRARRMERRKLDRETD